MVLAAEIGGFGRFATPRQLMAWLGLAPSEPSSGEGRARRHHQGRDQAGAAGAVLAEVAWSCRFPARVTSLIQARPDDVPEAVRATAWKAQLRPCAGFRRLVATGTNANLVATTVGREMAALAWPSDVSQARLGSVVIDGGCAMP